MRLTNFSCTCCYYSPLTQFATFLSTSFNHRSPIDFQSYQQPKSNWLQWSRIERHPKAKLHFLIPLSHVYAFLVVRCKNSSFFLWKRDKGKREEFNFCRAHHNCRLILKTGFEWQWCLGSQPGHSPVTRRPIHRLCWLRKLQCLIISTRQDTKSFNFRVSRRYQLCIRSMRF